MANQKYLTANEAIKALAVSKGTLYSYVSRGMIRSEETTGKTRARRYLTEDVMVLKRRKEQRRNPGSVAESALNFGDPVLESAISLIENGRLYYRGHDVIELAQKRYFEEIAALLWTGDFEMEGLFEASFVSLFDSLSGYSAIMQNGAALRPIELFQSVLPLIATEELAAYDLSPLGVARTGARLLAWMVSTITHQQEGRDRIAKQLQEFWVPSRAEAIPLLDTALILCADHELNVSSFTARCIASAGSTPYAAISGGLAALQGPRHGGDTERVTSLFEEAKGGARAAVGNRLKQGERIPGFGHPLYPDGDPRGRLLLDQVAQINPSAPINLLAKELQREVQNSIGLYPNVDFALVAMAQVLQLPIGAPLTLFALGRTAGWVGHLIEQYQSNQLIRPRARYVGEQPRQLF